MLASSNFFHQYFFFAIASHNFRDLDKLIKLNSRENFMSQDILKNLSGWNFNETHNLS